MERHHTVRYLAITGICVCAAWFASNISAERVVWPQILGFITSLITLITAEKIAGRTPESVQERNDRNLLNTLRAELPRDPLIRFAAETDFLIDFSGQPVRQIEEFWRTWDNPEHEFSDPQLEQSRQSLIAAISSWLDCIAKYATIEKHDVWRVRTLEYRHQEKFEEMWRNQAAEINGFARKIVNQYDRLLKRGRDRFPDPDA